MGGLVDNYDIWIYDYTSLFDAKKKKKDPLNFLFEFWKCNYWEFVQNC